MIRSHRAQQTKQKKERSTKIRRRHRRTPAMLAATAGLRAADIGRSEGEARF